MAAKIRLRKAGRRGQAAYRLVVLDGRKARDAKVTADLGFYDPKTNPPTFEVNGEEALKWLMEGAKPTKAARDILSRAGVMEAWDAAQRGEEIVIQAKDVKPTPEKSKAKAKETSAEEEVAPVAEAAPEEDAAAEDEATASADEAEVEEEAASSGEEVKEEAASSDEEVEEEAASSGEEVKEEAASSGEEVKEQEASSSDEDASSDTSSADEAEEGKA